MIAKRNAQAFKETCVSVDPSIRTCGLAVFKKGRLVFHALVKVPKECKQDSEWERAHNIYMQVRSAYVLWKATRIIIELPAHWANEGFAARESGNMGKLYFLCG